jgi:hypothetical protein
MVLYPRRTVTSTGQLRSTANSNGPHIFVHEYITSVSIFLSVVQVSNHLNKGRNLSIDRSLIDPERTDWVFRKTELAKYYPSIKFSELQAIYT